MLLNGHIEGLALVAESGRHRILETHIVCPGYPIFPLTIKIPSDRSESVPIPLWCIVQWEKRVLTSACPEPMVLILSFFLVLIWGSLRFSDAQRECQRHLMENENHPPGTSVWDHSSGPDRPLLGLQSSDKTLWSSMRTYVQMSKRSFHWLHKYLLTLDAVLTRQGMEYMDYLIPDISAQQGIVLPLQPMSYGTALKWLRYCINAPWKQQPSASLDPSVFTIHTCKATLLSELVSTESPHPDRRGTASTGSPSDFSQRLLETVQPRRRSSGTTSRPPTRGDTPRMATFSASTSRQPISACRTSSGYNWTILQTRHYGFPLVWLWGPTTIRRSVNPSSRWRFRSVRFFLVFLRQWVGYSNEGGHQRHVPHILNSVVGSHILASVTLWFQMILH